MRWYCIPPALRGIYHPCRSKVAVASRMRTLTLSRESSRLQLVRNSTLHSLPRGKPYLLFTISAACVHQSKCLSGQSAPRNHGNSRAADGQDSAPIAATR